MCLSIIGDLSNHLRGGIMSKKKKGKKKTASPVKQLATTVPAAPPRITVKAENVIVPASAPPDRQRNAIVAAQAIGETTTVDERFRIR